MFRFSVHGFYETGSGSGFPLLACLGDTISFVLDSSFEILDTPSPASRPLPSLLLIDQICFHLFSSYSTRIFLAFELILLDTMGNQSRQYGSL